MATLGVTVMRNILAIARFRGCSLVDALLLCAVCMYNCI